MFKVWLSFSPFFTWKWYFSSKIRFVSSIGIEDVRNTRHWFPDIAWVHPWNSVGVLLADLWSYYGLSNVTAQLFSTTPKSNHFYCHITTAQVPWWVKFLWACSRQCKKTTDNLPMDRQCKKTTNNLHMDRQCKKKQQTIYLWTDSAKKQQTIYIWTDSAKKLHWSIYSAPDSAKKTTAIYIWTDSAKKTTAIYIWTDSAKNNSNLHMDSTYLQTVQKTMCKIHIHILSTHSVL